MSNYESRLERLEQRVLLQDGSYNHVLVVFEDSDERPYDRIEYRETYGAEGRALTREDGESVPEFERRACSVWELTGKHLVCVHYVAKRFPDAAYETIGEQSPFDSSSASTG